MSIDWSTQWIGGFCSVVTPVRSADYEKHPSFTEVLPHLQTQPESEAAAEQVDAMWSECFGGYPVLLFKRVERAYQILLEAADLKSGEPVGLPANATHALVEAVKRVGGTPLFIGLSADLQLLSTPARINWAQPSLGLNQPQASAWVDYTDTLPLPGPIIPRHEVCLYGLHLSRHESGVVAVITNPELYERIQSLTSAADRPELRQAAARVSNLKSLGDNQRQRLAEVWLGIEQAVGLPLLPLHSEALSHGVAVQIPQESDAPTFLTYVQRENTPIRWLPQMRPIHYAAFRQQATADPQATADALARWLMVPVGPGYTEEEIRHSILGIVKTAEYLGVRWHTAPAYAAEYAELIEQMYGPEHDGYRPLFITTIKEV